jgi:hypothetical protein
MHIFFDTTALVADKTCSPKLGSITSQKLRDSSKAIGAHLYVADLAVTEAVYRRWRRLQSQFQAGKSIAEEIGAYADLRAGQSLDKTAILSVFRREMEDGLKVIPATMVTCSTVALDDVLSLSVDRVPPFIRPDDPTGFHDAVILLAPLCQYG